MRSLRCYNFLDQIKENSEIFDHVFCPGRMFSWTYDIFLKTVKPCFTESGSNKKNVEETMFKSFIDMVECIFMDGK